MSAVDHYSRLAVRIVDAKRRAVCKPALKCMQLVAADIGTTYGSLWRLIYKHPKSVKPELQRALHQAVVKLLADEVASLEHEHRALADWAAYAHPGELEEVQADLAALKERLAKLRGGKK